MDNEIDSYGEKETNDDTNPLHAELTPVCSFGSTRDRDPNTIGKPKKVIHDFKHPFYIQITDDGRVFLSEYGTNLVHLLDQNGNRLKKFAIPVGQATGIFVKGNVLYVTNHRKEIYIFDANTAHLLGVKFAKEPVAIAIDENDLMYVTEWRTGILQVFHRDGRKSHTMSTGGKGRYLRKIQFDMSGNVVVPVFHSKLIHVFSKSGDRRNQFIVPFVRYGEGLFIDSKGRMYLTDRGLGKVHILDKSGKLIKTIHGFKGASDVAIAPDGTVWVVDFVGHRIFLY